VWKARTKTDLIIEVWEKLDCESVGAVEIEAIGTVVADQYGELAVDSPMIVARLLADEGAELRHSEIMKIYLASTAERPYDAALRNIVKIDSLQSAAASIRNLENLRLKYAGTKDKEGLRLVREIALRGKQTAHENAGKKNTDPATQQVSAEIVKWLTVWLQTPEIFKNWLTLRQKSLDFVDKFGHMMSSEN